jgi:hypothetical protein
VEEEERKTELSPGSRSRSRSKGKSTASKQAAAAARGGLRSQFTSLNRLSPRPSAAASCCLLHKQQQQLIIITVPFEKKSVRVVSFACLFPTTSPRRLLNIFSSRFFSFPQIRRGFEFANQNHTDTRNRRKDGHCACFVDVDIFSYRVAL